MCTKYYKTKESVDEYIKLAKDVNGSSLIDRLKEFLPKNSLLLEIGSGPGNDYQILKETYNVVGSDFSKEFIKRLTSKYPNETFLNINAVKFKTNQKFDGIYSNKVLQHITNSELEESIKCQLNSLNNAGVICHSFWKGEGDEVFQGMMVNYQTKKSLKLLFEKYFEILLLEEYKEFEEADSILLIAKKK